MKSGINRDFLEGTNLEDKEREFREAEYPGIVGSPVDLVVSMDDREPDAFVESEVLREAERDCYKEAENIDVASFKSLYFKCIGIGFTLPSFQHDLKQNGHSCYSSENIPLPQTYLQAADFCIKKNGRLVDYPDIAESNHLSSILGNANISLKCTICVQGESITFAFTINLFPNRNMIYISLQNHKQPIGDAPVLKQCSNVA